MCTAICWNTKNFYFGRNMDICRGFGQEAVVTERGRIFDFVGFGKVRARRAIIGMATVRRGVPLFADAANDAGLCAAALAFVNNAFYANPQGAPKTAVAPFELISLVLATCESADEAAQLLTHVSVVDVSFDADTPNTQLHWIFADRERAITVEARRDGVHVFENRAGVLTNNPPFEFHSEHLAAFSGVSPAAQGDGVLSGAAPLSALGFGYGAYGLPGDPSSPSRFVRAAYMRRCARETGNARFDVATFFSMLGSVAVPYGCVLGEQDAPHYTVYSSCIDVGRGKYYWRRADLLETFCISL